MEKIDALTKIAEKHGVEINIDSIE